MTLSASSVHTEGRFHFDIESYQTEFQRDKYSRVVITKKLAQSLGIPDNFDDLNNANLRGIKLSLSQHRDIAVYVLNQSGNTKLLINYWEGFNSELFIKVFNEAIPEKMPVHFNSEKGLYNHQMHLYAQINTADESVIFELFRNMLMLSAVLPQSRYSKLGPKTKEDFENDLNTLFRIEAAKGKIDEANQLFEAKNFDAAYNMIWPNRTLPENKGKFLEYGKRLREDGDYEEAIRFLSAEHSSHTDTHDKAQMQLFEILGDILSQDASEPFLDEEERRHYKRNRIKLAHNLEETNPKIKGLADTLFCDYAGCPVIGEKPTFSLKTDPYELALQLAEALYTERMRNQQPQQQVPSSAKPHDPSKRKRLA